MLGDFPLSCPSALHSIRYLLDSPSRLSDSLGTGQLPFRFHPLELEPTTEASYDSLPLFGSCRTSLGPLHSSLGLA